MYIFLMKLISLKDLKENLSQWTEEAAKGTAIQVTRYNKPYVFLLGVQSPSLHIGKSAGTATLRSAASAASKGKFHAVLKEDRDESDE